MTTLTLPNTRLYYKDGSSDKEYHASINEVEGGYTVTFAYGRRGASLTAGTKTNSPVPLAKAQQVYDKLVAEKTSKGYTPSGDGVLFTQTENAERTSGLTPQLLNPITEEEALRYLHDSDWGMQEKCDGMRIMVRVENGVVKASNRKGLFVPVLTEIEAALKDLPDCVIDGEMVGSHYYAFDLLEEGTLNRKEYSVPTRHNALMNLVSDRYGIHVVPLWIGAESKQQWYDYLVKQNAEGVVFKRLAANYVPGRPASGGSQLKCKFYATATCMVGAQNQQRSVQLLMFTPEGHVSVGNVTIPPNKEVPGAGSWVEVRYLYAYEGGSLYQPTYLGPRTDVSVEDCMITQLKYKAAGASNESDEG